MLKQSLMIRRCWQRRAHIHVHNELEAVPVDGEDSCGKKPKYGKTTYLHTQDQMQYKACVANKYVSHIHSSLVCAFAAAKSLAC